MLKNTQDSYGLITKIFHWLIAFAILGLITVGLSMTDMPSSPEKYELYGMHKASGVMVLMLVILRILWRISNKEVMPPKSLSNMMNIKKKIGHYVLYLFMLLMPISGILMTHFSSRDIPVFGLFTIPAAAVKDPQIAGLFHQVHVLGIWAFITVIILHIGAALYHHFVLKNNILKRMIK